MSQRNTGTPMSEKDSAITFIVTVLPVPVAPAMMPWRLAIFGRMKRFLSDCAIHILLSVNIAIPHIFYFADKGILSQLFAAYKLQLKKTI